MVNGEIIYGSIMLEGSRVRMLFHLAAFSCIDLNCYGVNFS